MPLDDRGFPAQPETTQRNNRLLALWLFSLCAMILVMIVLGGITRLTGSGLSIMEWAPFTGTLPPLSEAEWQRLYRLYQQIPQYQLVNQGFGLSGFKQIFWLEWTHRLWGRLIGLAFLLPLVWLWMRGAIPRRLVPRLALLFGLGGLQGAVGWFMVASGFFPDSTAVSPARLELHLALALVLYAALLWTGLTVLRPTPATDSPKLRHLAQALAALVSLTVLAGGFVAGLHAGLAYNTFPLMDGQLVPRGYFTDPIATVQFDHRLLATLTALAAAAAVAIGLRTAPPGLARAAVVALGITVAAQYLLGIATLLSAVPVALATAHQATAVLVLTATLTLLHTLRRT